MVQLHAPLTTADNATGANGHIARISLGSTNAQQICTIAVIHAHTHTRTERAPYISPSCSPTTSSIFITHAYICMYIYICIDTLIPNSQRVAFACNISPHAYRRRVAQTTFACNCFPVAPSIQLQQHTPTISCICSLVSRFSNFLIVIKLKVSFKMSRTKCAFPLAESHHIDIDITYSYSRTISLVPVNHFISRQWKKSSTSSSSFIPYRVR